jgi:hypothetical protein
MWLINVFHLKPFLLTIGGCLLLTLSYGQDVLIKRTGDEVQTKVLEITPTEIKYKRFDNLEGPTISILKADVFMIKYENGSRETFVDAGRPAPAPGQDTRPAPFDPVPDHLRLAGPRVGFTILSQRYADHLNREFNSGLNPFITQFGWQFETRMFTLDNGVTGLFEFVPLVGGLEQGKFLPSLSALIGVRGAKGLEFGVGPNVSLAGAGLVFAVGTNFQAQGVNFPVNVAVAPSRQGGRFSLLFGFNSRKR